MGYRHRFASVPTATINLVRDMTPQELEAWLRQNNSKGLCRESDDEPVSFVVYDLLGQTEFFDFGKDCDWAGELISRSTPLFTNPDTQEKTEGIVICGKNEFLFVIEQFRLLIHNYYKKCIDEPIECMKFHFAKTAEEWGNITETLGFEMEPEKAVKLNAMHRPYNLDDNTDTIVSSWKFEYEIFELVRLYKTFDWENKSILFYGW